MLLLPNLLDVLLFEVLVTILDIDVAGLVVVEELRELVELDLDVKRFG